MILYDNIPKLDTLIDTYGLFLIGTVVRENADPLYLAWNTISDTAVLLHTDDLTNPSVYCVVDDDGKPKRNTGLSVLLFNRQYIDNDPVAFYGVKTGTKLQTIFIYLSAYISLCVNDGDNPYDIDHPVQQSVIERIDKLVKENN